MQTNNDHEAQVSAEQEAILRGTPELAEHVDAPGLRLISLVMHLASRSIIEQDALGRPRVIWALPDSDPQATQLRKLLDIHERLVLQSWPVVPLGETEEERGPDSSRTEKFLKAMESAADYKTMLNQAVVREATSPRSPERSTTRYRVSAAIIRTTKRAIDLLERRIADEFARTAPLCLAANARLVRDVSNWDRRRSDTSLSGKERSALARPAQVRETARWLLALPRPEEEVSPADQAARRLRRGQALELYGALREDLLRPEVTRAIDSGNQLNPVLRSALGGAPQFALDRVRGAWSAERAICEQIGLTVAVRRLLHFAVPERDWPAAGDGAAWLDSPWIEAETATEGLIRDDYMLPSKENTTRRQRRGGWTWRFGGALDDDKIDTAKAAWSDLVEPAIQAEITRNLERVEVPLSEDLIRQMAPRALELAEKPRVEFRDVMLRFQEALIGRRQVSGFSTAVEQWHRFAASIAAARMESKVIRPGWPSLMQRSWLSSDRVHKLTPLTRAKHLLEEGMALHHCVGNYYHQCRTGRVHILSMTRDGKRYATLEIRVPELKGDADRIDPSELTFGQFRGDANSLPDASAQLALEEFRAALLAGRINLNASAIASFQAERKKAGVRDDNATTIETARSLFPTYARTLLTGAGRDADYQAWLARTGIGAAIESAVATHLGRLGVMLREPEPEAGSAQQEPAP